MQATQYFNAFAHGIWFLHSFTHTYVCIVCSNIFTRNILKNFTLTFVFRCEGKSSLTLFHLATKKIFSVASSRRLPEKVNFRPWINHSSYFHKLNRCEIKALKKFMLDPYSDPWKIIYWNCYGLCIITVMIDRGHEFEFSSSLIFPGFNFTAASTAFITTVINYVFISFSVVQIYGLSYIYFYSSPSRNILQTHNLTSFQLTW